MICDTAIAVVLPKQTLKALPALRAEDGVPLSGIKKLDFDITDVGDVILGVLDIDDIPDLIRRRSLLRRFFYLDRFIFLCRRCRLISNSFDFRLVLP